MTGYFPHLVNLPADAPDRAATVADLRTAQSLAAGAAPEDIDPATGADLSLASYLVVRESWVSHLTHHPPGDLTPAWWGEARAYWEARRPKHLADHPWPELPSSPATA